MKSMTGAYANILSPAGVAALHRKPGPASRKSAAGKPVIGLLNNSKPNVACFLEALEDELRRGGDYEIVSMTKPRSAAAAPDIDALAERCHFVINAVAD
jgi:hypothetical protein